jgi:hypothetical protein
MEHRHKYLALEGSFDRGQQHWLQKMGNSFFLCDNSAF